MGNTRAGSSPAFGTRNRNRAVISIGYSPFIVPGWAGGAFGDGQYDFSGEGMRGNRYMVVVLVSV